MLKKSGMILLGIGIGLLLSSCHIKQKDVETIARTTNSLRIYQPNDLIEYNVTAIVSSGTTLITSLGTLRVEWALTPDLTDPFDGFTKYTVLKETSTLTYDINSNEPGATIIRYISQDSNGNITLYAIDDGAGLFWLYDTANTGNLSSDIILPVIFDSPMAVGTPPPNSPIDFLVMEGCGDTVGLCLSEIYKFNDSYNVVGDTTSITTNRGIFSNPFEITFSGGTVPNGNPAVSFWGDIRDVCGTSADTVTHIGTMYVMPEIGMVRMTNFCQNQSGGNNVQYVISLENTNIPLP